SFRVPNRGNSGQNADHDHGASDVANNPSELTNASGAYLPLIDIERQVEMPRRFANTVMGVGHYAYAGSAYGPGGIRACCRRQLGRPSKLRWHVDWLTRAADEI
ncbi:MAG: DUF123 domain-containing protein, partial [Geminicoccaceae bacterium]